MKIKRNYLCPKCFENFGNKKSNYERHMNRKIPCSEIAPIAPDFAPIAPDFAPVGAKNEHFCKEITLNVSSCANTNSNTGEKNEHFCKEITSNVCDKPIGIKKIYCCVYCDSKFSRKYCLDRHLDKRCKKIPNENNQAIQNDNENENDNIKFIVEQLKHFKNELIKIKEENTKVKDENKQLKAKIDKVENKIMSKTINAISNCNNTINNIINFSNVDYSKIDTDYFIGPMLDNKLYGRSIVLKVIENVHVNDKLPEYKNYMITDKNRGYAKMYDGGQWKTTDVNGVEIILSGIIEHMRALIDEIEDGNLEPVKKALKKEIQDIKIDFVNRRIEINKKYLDKSDLDKIAELKEDDENKEKIKTYIEYRDILITDIKNMFHDNKDKIKLVSNSKLIGICE